MIGRPLILITCCVTAVSAWTLSAEALPTASRTQAAPDANSTVETVARRGFSGRGFSARGFSGRRFAGRSFFRPRTVAWGRGYRGFRTAGYWGGSRWWGPRRLYRAAAWGPRVRWYRPRYNWWPGRYASMAYWGPSYSYWRPNTYFYWGRGTNWGPSTYSYWRPRTVYWGADRYWGPSTYSYWRPRFWSPFWGRGYGQAHGWTGWR
jgi:hypothetical protein